MEKINISKQAAICTPVLCTICFSSPVFWTDYDVEVIIIQQESHNNQKNANDCRNEKYSPEKSVYETQANVLWVTA